MLFEGAFHLHSNGDQSYDVAADGRFLMIQEEPSDEQLVVVTNFFEELKRLVPN